MMADTNDFKIFMRNAIKFLTFGFKMYEQGKWASPKKAFVKVLGRWLNVKLVYKKESGKWVKQSDISAMFDTDALYFKG